MAAIISCESVIPSRVSTKVSESGRPHREETLTGSKYECVSCLRLSAIPRGFTLDRKPFSLLNAVKKLAILSPLCQPLHMIFLRRRYGSPRATRPAARLSFLKLHLSASRRSSGWKQAAKFVDPRIRFGKFKRLLRRRASNLYPAEGAKGPGVRLRHPLEGKAAKS